MRGREKGSLYMGILIYGYELLGSPLMEINTCTHTHSGFPTTFFAPYLGKLFACGLAKNMEEPHMTCVPRKTKDWNLFFLF